MTTMLSRRCRAALAVFLLCWPSIPVAAEEPRPRVWTLTSWTRALRSDPVQPLKPVSVFAARNEWESFQIAVRAEKAARVLDIEVSPLAGDAGSKIPGLAVRRYRVHQLHLTRATYRNDSFREDWYPDALIPFPDQVGEAGLNRATLRAVPFDLAAGETHTFWIDVCVPEAAKPGTYRGKASVLFDGAAAIELPIELRVWPFALPRRASMRTEFGSAAARIQGWYRDQVKKGAFRSAPDGAALHEACAQLTGEHRLNSYPPPELMELKLSPDGSFELTSQQVAGWKEFLSKHHVNALAVAPPQHYFKDPIKERESIERYLRSWDRAAEAVGRPDLLCYTYLIDEPNDREAYEFTRTWGRLVREAGSRVKVLVTEQTKTQDSSWGDLYGAVDIWVPLFSLNDPETAEARRALGDEIWTYTALCQGKPTPWWHIDYPLLNYRIVTWMAWSHRMKGLLYWGGLSHWRDVEDPWTQPETYRPDGDKGAIFNGEGTLLYPGVPVGIEGPVPSVRLKALRDGLEDFDYLTMLEMLGRREQAEAEVRSVAASFYEWNKDPEAWIEVRKKIGGLIEDASKAQNGGRPSPSPGSESSGESSKPSSSEAGARFFGAYAVVVSQATFDDPAWREVVDALVAKHGAEVMRFTDSIAESREPLSKRMPRYVAFVARPEEAGRKFVVGVHRMMRRLDEDPYADALWGIVTGYGPAAALRIARCSEPLIVRKAAAGTGIDLGLFDEGIWYSEGEAGLYVEKGSEGKVERKKGPQDSTREIVKTFNEFQPDLFLTSGHATERDWQIGYSYRNGQLRCKGGTLFGLDLGGKAYAVNSPNPKIYLALGNCLMGHIADKESMALAFMGSGGVCQMVGYVVSTWFGYGGWGVRDYFMEQPGRFTLAEAFFSNCQALVHRLETKFPEHARFDIEKFNIEEDQHILERVAASLGYRGGGGELRELLGLLWDRDTVAFYGDPAWEARLRPRELSWEQKLTERTKPGDEAKGVYTFELKASRDTGWGRPPFELFPWRLEGVEIVEGADLKPTITDSFLLLAAPEKFEKGKTYRVIFKARPAAVAGPAKPVTGKALRV